MKINLKNNNGFDEEEIFKVANSRLGWYKRAGMNIINFIEAVDTVVPGFASNETLLYS